MYTWSYSITDPSTCGARNQAEPLRRTHGLSKNPQSLSTCYERMNMHGMHERMPCHVLSFPRNLRALIFILGK